MFPSNPDSARLAVDIALASGDSGGSLTNSLMVGNPLAWSTLACHTVSVSSVVAQLRLSTAARVVELCTVLSQAVWSFGPEAVAAQATESFLELYEQADSKIAQIGARPSGATTGPSTVTNRPSAVTSGSLLRGISLLKTSTPGLLRKDSIPVGSLSSDEVKLHFLKVAISVISGLNTSLPEVHVAEFLSLMVLCGLPGKNIREADHLDILCRFVTSYSRLYYGLYLWLADREGHDDLDDRRLPPMPTEWTEALIRSIPAVSEKSLLSATTACAEYCRTFAASGSHLPASIMRVLTTLLGDVEESFEVKCAAVRAIAVVVKSARDTRLMIPNAELIDCAEVLTRCWRNLPEDSSQLVRRSKFFLAYSLMCLRRHECLSSSAVDRSIPLSDLHDALSLESVESHGTLSLVDMHMFTDDEVFTRAPIHVDAREKDSEELDSESWSSEQDFERRLALAKQVFLSPLIKPTDLKAIPLLPPRPTARVLKRRRTESDAPKSLLKYLV